MQMKSLCRRSSDSFVIKSTRYPFVQKLFSSFLSLLFEQPKKFPLVSIKNIHSDIATRNEKSQLYSVESLAKLNNFMNESKHVASASLDFFYVNNFPGFVKTKLLLVGKSPLENGKLALIFFASFS